MDSLGLEEDGDDVEEEVEKEVENEEKNEKENLKKIVATEEKTTTPTRKNKKSNTENTNNIELSRNDPIADSSQTLPGTEEEADFGLGVGTGVGTGPAFQSGGSVKSVQSMPLENISFVFYVLSIMHCISLISFITVLFSLSLSPYFSLSFSS